jgi:DNA-binding NarL/FixJ family response regulator
LVSRARLSVLQAIHAIAFEERQWAPALASLVHYLEADRGLLFSPTDLAGALPGAAHDFDPSFFPAYSGYWHKYDLWTQRAHELGIAQQVRVSTSEELVPQRTFLRSPIYNECLRLSDVGRLMTSALMPTASNPEGLLFAGAFRRSARAAPFPARAQRRYTALLPQLSQALHGWRRLRAAEANAGLWRWTIERLAAPVLVLDDAARIVEQSSAVESLLAEQGGLSLRADGLMAATAAGQSALAAAFAAARAGLAQSATVTDRFGAPTLRVHMMPVPPRYEAFCGTRRSVCLVMLEAFPRQATSGLMALHGGTPTATATARAEQHLRTAGLTARECEVALLLAEGASNKEVGARLGVSTHTARHHTERILRKLGIASRQQVARFVYGASTGGR